MTTQEINNTLAIDQAKDLLFRIKYLPLNSGIDSWKEKRSAEWNKELNQFPKEIVQKARLNLEKETQDIKEMSTNRNRKVRSRVDSCDELSAKYYF